MEKTYDVVQSVEVRLESAILLLGFPVKHCRKLASVFIVHSSDLDPVLEDIGLF
jgi:hypothetical protein